MTRRAYQIPIGVDPTTLPFVFEGERNIVTDSLGYVEVDGTLTGYDEVPVRLSADVPESVDARQFFLELESEGLTSTVEAIVAAASVEVQISFNKSQKFFRNNPLVLQVADALNKSATELDDFFIRAKAR